MIALGLKSHEFGKQLLLAFRKFSFIGVIGLLLEHLVIFKVNLTVHRLTRSSFFLGLVP